MSQRPSPRVLLVNPQFSEHSFWNYQETCKVVGARYVAAPLGLITVAALLPADWTIRLADRNIEELRDEDLRWADLVMVGGMLPQQRDAKRIIAMAHACDRPVVMGGPDVTASPEVYAEADFRVIGEAEEVMREFVAAWLAGVKRGVYTAKAFPDLKTSPVPRFDLLKLRDYMHVGVQFSRGCPFNCEFCNVIELNGRTCRFKTPAQMLRELDALHALGYRGHVDFVDDNLIGNRATLKPFLAELGVWLRQHGHPFEFSSEASLNLADDAELLAAMRDAGFFGIFVGIETPDRKTLVSTNKLQNARRDIATSIAKINRAGIFVNAGFIVGFDAEGATVAQAMVDCIEEAAIPICMVGLLYALPNTQLYRRLLAEGRLHADSDRVASDDETDQCTTGLNYVTLRPRRDILADYRAVLERIYRPEAYFGRVRRTARVLGLSRHTPPSPIHHTLRDLRSFARISLQMGLIERRVRAHYWRAVFDCLIHNPRAIRTVVSLAALYLHIGPFTRYLDDRLLGQIATLDAPGVGAVRALCPRPAIAESGVEASLAASKPASKPAPVTASTAARPAALDEAASPVAVKIS